ncbi:type VI secretion system contractile sheath small subunit [Niveispirillum sp. SYP-B3756]|uniref:type VI secretion system contractile sheath small subunit n=1 Tax=unclassified Niveispirillum TaxID=2649257 RepID=UPI001292A6C3|nr:MULTISPECIES: type VI secretion system contractile sheath small subunit [unclassified Niveispirillum]MDG5493791.1 type VI secretion system contractile sheath small subunit [Niveispirillum sp. BGYR6]MQP67333.1 type VI secretion system contractile sheath small subunit [Niveispirillum sp. SYP-B3756]
MADSTQQKLSRVRPPRVQITYDVENGGAIEKKELPFIVGVMADLSGKPATPLPPVKDRKFVEIDRDNFNEVLSAATPRLALRVPNKLVKDSDEQLAVELTFSHLDDFSPVEVMGQVPALKALLDARKRLRDLLTKLDGNDELDSLLNQVVRNTEDQSTLKKQLGSAG